MRPLELALVVGLLVLAVLCLRPSWRTLVRPVAVVVLLVGVAHVVLEGHRWQLWPAYGGVGVAALLAAAGPRDEPASPRLTAVVAALAALLAGGLGAALPVPELELRVEETPVGTTEWVLVDDARDRRRVVVQAWYPTDADTGQRDAVTSEPDEFAAAAGGFLGLPPALLDHLGLATTQAFVDAPLSVPAGGLPVVLQVHGWGGFRKAQVLLAEALAADGHLVLAVDHTGGAIAAEFPDGEVVPIDMTLLPEGAPPPVYDAASTRLERLFADDVALALADLRADDGTAPVPLRAAADLDRLVLLGHSTGGGAAVWACGEEPACDGVVGYDPWVEPLPPAVREAGLAVPLLSVRSGAWVGNDNDADLLVLHGATADERLMAVPGTEHRDVTVLPLLSPLASTIGLAGDVDPTTTQRVVRDLTRAFLAEVLGSGTGDPGLLDAPPAPVVLDDA